MGDACGTGPELIALALADEHVRSICRPVIVGDLNVVRAAFKIAGSSLTTVACPDVHRDFPVGDSDVAVYDLANLNPREFEHGKICAAAGRAAHEAITAAVRLTFAGKTDAVVTSAINKAALHQAGFAYDGHTELLAELCGGPPVTMMLVADKLRVCHVSTHVSLREAISRASIPRILEVVRLAHDGVRKLGVPQPRLAIAGLNPHAGEGGLFGDEEIKIIAPAVAEARRQGYDVSGPYAGDTVFFRTLQGEFDCAIAMFHDQGHVAAKMLGIWRGVNVTLGLPIIRTSVEHGTDFANAGKGTGDPRSLIEAIKLAATMVANRR